MTNKAHADDIQTKHDIKYLKDYQQPAYWIDDVKLQFDLDIESTLVSSQLQIRRNESVASDDSSLYLDGKDLQLKRVSVNGRELSEDEYERDTKGLLIKNVPTEFTLETLVILNPMANTSLEGLYYAGEKFCSQCEPEGFRRISFFSDRPDVMSRYEVRLIANKDQFPVLLSNGNLIDQGNLSNGKHFAVWRDPSLKPCYLFALVAANLQWQEDSFTTFSGKHVNLRIYTEKENIHKCDHAMQSLKQAMRWDEEYYGREYDLENYMIVAVNDFNTGAMENKGLNLFNSSFVLASSETATDEDYYNIQNVVGHEYFHNWSGNRVTCRDWFQLSLKEGFTVFRDQQFSAEMNSPVVKRINDVNILRNVQFTEDSGPIAHPVRPDQYMEINNFYTVTVYNKGAEVIRMLHSLLGAERFRDGTNLYFSRYDGQAVTTDDFICAMEESNKLDLTQFKLWYEQAGTPVVSIKDEYDPQRYQYKLLISQSCPDTPNQTNKKPFHIPIEYGLLDPHTGEDMRLDHSADLNGAANTHVIQLTQSSEEIVFEGVDKKPVPSLLRKFSAPVKIHYERSEQDLAFLLANDSDPFNCWDAGQNLALKQMLRQVEAYQKNERMSEPAQLTESIKKLIQTRKGDPALLAQILNLPSEIYLAEQLDVIDVDAVFNARLFTRRFIAETLYDDLLVLFHANQEVGSYEFNSIAVAKRSLKNVALEYLMETESDAVIDLCVQQFRNASNMTDRQAALTFLSNFDISQRQTCLDEFYQQFKDDPQVTDKWFAVQCRSRLPSSYATTRDLLKHPDFNIKNPNKVRAVLASYCLYNPVNFHRKDGLGYELFAEQVLELNTINPLIAAKLAKFISRWCRYDEQRQQKMRDTLMYIRDSEGLSNEVYEIVTRSLNDA